MILAYAVRLVCLCFASFFLLNAAIGLLVRLFSSSAVRFAERRTPGAAARFLFVLRLSPFSLAALFVLGLCVPSYLWLEPARTTERVGLLCVVFGFLGGSVCLVSLLRAVRAVIVSIRHSRSSASTGRHASLPAELPRIVVVQRDAPLLALAGLFRPKLFVSPLVLRELNAEQLEVAFSHEWAHSAARDNVKRLLFLLAPDILPFVRPLRALEKGWSKFAEWAADDTAAAGSPLRAVSLAGALVRVARLGASPCLPYLSTSLLADDRDLSARVERLLRPAPVRPLRRSQREPLLARAVFVFAGCLGALLLSPLILPSVHELLERFLH
jgi:beta-lactamase regulating signal transducer with metallopeptidase domain